MKWTTFFSGTTVLKKLILNKYITLQLFCQLPWHYLPALRAFHTELRVLHRYACPCACLDFCHLYLHTTVTVTAAFERSGSSLWTAARALLISVNIVHFFTCTRGCDCVRQPHVLCLNCRRHALMSWIAGLVLLGVWTVMWAVKWCFQSHYHPGWSVVTALWIHE